MDLQQLAGDAAAAIHRRGWTQGTYEEHATGPVCAVGAIRCAVTGSAWHSDPSLEDEMREVEAKTLVADVLWPGWATAEHGGDFAGLLRFDLPGGPIISWNDSLDPKTGKDFVLAFFDNLAGKTPAPEVRGG